MTRTRRSTVHVARGPYGRLRAHRTAFRMYLRIVFDGASPHWAAMLYREVRGIKPREVVSPRAYGAASAARVQYERRVWVR